MRASVMLGDNVNMSNVGEIMSSLLDGIEKAEFRFLRTIPTPPGEPKINFIVEVNAKTPEDIRTIYDRAIERW